MAVVFLSNIIAECIYTSDMLGDCLFLLFFTKEGNLKNV